MSDTSPPLVVDLDQTLIKEDIFFEMFANYMQANPVKALYLLNFIPKILYSLQIVPIYPQQSYD